jgi:hypothetical protein
MEGIEFGVKQLTNRKANDIEGTKLKSIKLNGVSSSLTYTSSSIY